MIGFRPDARHGPLPALLVLLTLSTGLIDAATFLGLGHVFVANMTGNVVFLAFALGGSTEFSVIASFSALVCFLVGAMAGGRLHLRHGAHRGRQLAVACTAQVLLVAGAFALSLWAGWRGLNLKDMPPGYAMIALLAIAMGLQNATVRSLGVPGLTTTVMTATLTGIAADSGSAAAAAGGRLRPLGVVILFVGAAVGAVLVLNNRSISPALGLVLALLVATSMAAYRLSRGAPVWASP